MSNFSLLISLGTLAGLGLIAVRSPKKLTTRYIDAALGVLLSALVVSRLIYALTNWDYFHLHTGEIFQVWLGGLSAPGALLGALLGMLFLRIIQLFFLGPLADGMLPLLGTLSIAAWLGCWSDGTAYGAASSSWFALPAADEWGTVAPRVPVQLLGALLTLGLFTGLEQARMLLRRPGLAASLGLLGWGLIFLGLTFLRADPAQLWSGLRLEAWGALGVIAVGLVGSLAVMLPKKRRSPVEQSEAAA